SASTAARSPIRPAPSATRRSGQNNDGCCMKGGVRKFGRAERGLLPEGRLSGPMPWVIAIMMFLTVLAAAAGMGLASAASRLDDQIGGRVTIQIVEANPARKAAQTEAAAAARVDDNGQWLAPLASLIGALKWLAAGLVLLMVGATAATVVLAARAALDMHRATIEVLHLMGATDVQVARLFQRRIALDALFGGLIGFILAALVLIGLGQRVSALGSELLGSANVPAPAWGILVGLPLFGVLLAMLVARLTILRAL